MLTYRVAASLGYSRRERTRLCHRVIAAPASVGMEHSARDVPGWADAVLHDAVLLDELRCCPHAKVGLRRTRQSWWQIPA
jgi:hypothetical protein